MQHDAEVLGKKTETIINGRIRLETKLYHVRSCQSCQGILSVAAKGSLMLVGTERKSYTQSGRNAGEMSDD